MSKTEMVNRLIIMGCVKETQRNYLMKRDAKNLLKLYIHLVSKKGVYSDKRKKRVKVNKNNMHKFM